MKALKTMKEISKVALVVLAAVALASGCASQGEIAARQTGGIGAVKSGYVLVNGLNMYYEVQGVGPGKPALVLIHGGVCTIDTCFGKVRAPLAKNRKTVAVELQEHGHTADVDRPLSFELMADDVAALINQLGLKKVDMIGYSLGGGVALQTAIRYPTVLRKLTLVSTPCKRQGWYPEVLARMASTNAESAQAMIGSPPHQAYASAAPRPQDWPVLVEKTGRLLRQDYDWSADVAALKAPTLLVFADADSVRPEHIVEMFQLRGGGKQDAGWDGSGMSNARLAILPATTHYNIFFSPLLAPCVTRFLDEPMPEVK